MIYLKYVMYQALLNLMKLKNYSHRTLKKYNINMVNKNIEDLYFPI